MIKHIFFDFNGTIINDVDLCLEILNNLLKSQGKECLDINRYKEVFKFPIKQYYADAGVDFNIEPFESLAVKFIDEYQPRSLSCGLYENVVDTIKMLRERGIKTYILSASERNNLIEQCKHYNICDLFDAILGIDNIHATSKVDIALDFINKSKINKEEAMFIGDTLHDYEVAQAMGVKCVLVSCGHQSIDLLSKAGVPILDGIKDVVKELKMKVLYQEDFKDLELNEFPYDKFHTALGEYHHFKEPGNYGNWYDPIPLHQWRSLDGSWLITSCDNKRYLEQNRGDNTKDAFKNVYCVLVHKAKLYADYELEFNIRLFELNHLCGMAFSYVTSRNYYAVGIDGNVISLYKRYQDDFTIIDSKKLDFDDLKTYNIKVKVSNNTKVYLNGKLILEGNINYILGTRFACVAKSACRYSDILIRMEDNDYEKHLLEKEKAEKKLLTKREEYPSLGLIHKIDLKGFGTGRQLRIAIVDDKPVFLMAQHQKRMIRDSFARLSCLTAFDYEGNVLWQVGEENNIKDNTLISCDLPFQVADMNNDGKLEVIYSMDFEVIIADLLTGKVLKKMPTPIIKGDELVKNEPFYRLNVDAIRVADFKGLGYKSDFIIKDRYQNVWAYDNDFNLLWRYHHKNTGHFPYIYDFDEDGKDEMFVGYDMIDHDGKMIFSLPMNSDHTDEIIYAKLNKNEPKRLVLASGNEGMNIVNLDGSIYKHNNIGHAQRISVAKYDNNIEGLQICATAFWGSDGIVCLYDCHGNLLKEFEQSSNGNLITPVNYDGKHILSLLHSGSDGGLIDHDLDKVILFPNDGHPTLCSEVYDIDNDGIDEILCWDQKTMWIYKASSYTESKKFEKYPDEGFSNYRGEYLIPLDL